MDRGHLEHTVTGCSKFSLGCKLLRGGHGPKAPGDGQPNYRNGFEVTPQPHMLDKPLTWRKSQTIFVNSMSDLFQNGTTYPWSTTSTRRGSCETTWATMSGGKC